MNTLTIDVRKKHLDAAVRSKDGGSTLTCLLAQAIRQAFPKKYVQVGYTSVSIGNGKHRKTFELSKAGQRLISRFDKYSWSKEAVDRRGLASLRASLPASFTITEELKRA